MERTFQVPRPEAVFGAMPDTHGLNYFLTDPNLKLLLEMYVSASDRERAWPHLIRLGEIAGSELDRLARVADKHPPELVTYNPRGERVDEVVYHPAYHEMEKIGFGQFGLHAMTHREGVLGWPGPFTHVLKYAFWYLFAQAEFGLCCPMSMTDTAATVLERFGSEELKKTYLPRMLSTDMDQLWTGGQFMTEKQGGSDVGANTVVAKHVGDRWELWGDKWFCSNASADVILVLARPEGAPEGTKGLGLFLVPRRLPDGARNRFRINRLKDKLGTKDMASAEVTFEGAVGYVVGELSKGFKQMMTMVNLSRLSNAVRSAAMMRRSYLEALVSTRGRMAFGQPIAQLPLMQETLFELMLDTEAAASLVFYTAHVYDRAEKEGGDAQTLLRTLTPLLKGKICKRARYTTAEGMEARGGNGYIEEWVNARLVRDAHLGSVWEGTTNIIALDVLRALRKNQAADVFFGEIQQLLDGLTDPTVRQVADLFGPVVKRVHAQAERILHMEKAEQEMFSKRLMNRMVHVAVVTLFLREAEFLIVRENNYRKLLLSVHYLYRAFLSHGLDEPECLDRNIRQWLQPLIDWEPIPVEAAQTLLSQLKNQLTLSIS